MKIKFKYITVLCALIVAVTACFDDDTLTYSTEHSTVTIYNSKINFNATPGDILEISMDSIVEVDREGKKLIIDANSDKYSFTWRKGGYGGFIEDPLSNEYKLKLKIKAQSHPYLTFVVREISTGLEYFKNFSIDIRYKTGFGLGIVDTKDNVHSNFHEIQNMYVSIRSSDELKVEKNTYKNITGNDFVGLVSHISYYQNYSLPHSVLNVFTKNNACYAYDGLFNKLADSKNMFVFKQDNYNILNLDKSLSHQILLSAEGKLQSAKIKKYVFSHPFITIDESDYRVSHYRAQPSFGQSTYIYDEIGNRFMKNKPDGQYLYPVEGKETLFDYDKVGAYDAVYMGSGYSKSSWGDTYIVTILKSESGSNYFAYIFNANNNLNDNQKIVSLANCTDINQATNFATSPLEKILYYSVGSKLYSVSLSGSGIPVSYLAYETPSSGDEITNVKMWKDYTFMYTTDISNPSGKPIKKNAQNRMLVITTYNKSSSEGKFIAVPIRILDNAKEGLENNVMNHRVFGGFGRILAFDSL
ncbi:hypothetical protein L3073_07940 [Ancylomarina sp. DW003]|nr:hypothetical protein [Ancylomarina sp. DW003]MDE5422136.1 hypothetical protein [Ancylomarina sp. DW003]